MFLHSTNDLLLFFQAFGSQDFGKAGELWQRDVAMVTAAGAAISRLGDDFGIWRPDNLTVAVPAAGETSPSQR